MEGTRKSLEEYIGQTLYDVNLNPVYVVDERDAVGHLRKVSNVFGYFVGYVDENSNLVIRNATDRPNAFGEIGYD